jgi:hypothetical protein
LKQFFRSAVEGKARQQNALAAELLRTDKSGVVDDLD